MRILELKIPPPLVFLLVALGMWWLANFPLLPARLVLVLPLLAAGGLCGMWALWIFLRQHTSIDPHRPGKASKLVTDGIYRYTRNPMYLGLGLILIAWADMLGNPVALAGPILFVAYITRFQIQPEERILLERFGTEYLAYCQRVRRWL